jgi:lysophospholipase L1-like esterase
MSSGLRARDLPALIGQGVDVIRTMPRLPAAEGTRGAVGAGDRTWRLGLLGESTAAGVGVDHNERGLAGHCAAQLAEATGSAVEWSVVARNGATARAVTKELLPTLAPQLDSAVVVLGVNDLMRGRSLRAWEGDARSLLRELRARLGPDAVVVVSGLPPFGEFPFLEPPLRTVLARRAHALNEVLARVTAETGEHYVPVETELDEPFFSSDRFHPSARGYSIWAGALVEPIVEPARAR